MADIAKHLHVSKVTVHKALSDKTDISDELKRRVLDAAIKLNYKRIDPLTKQCRHFYYIVPKRFTTLFETFYYGIFQELSKKLNDAGITLEHYVADSNFDAEDFVRNNQRYAAKNKALFGIFWAGVISENTLNDFLKLGIPIVCIDNFIQNSNGSFIYIDDYHAGYTMTNYLIDMGHRNICFVIEAAVSTNIDKFFGFRKSLHEHHIDFSPNMHIDISLANMQNFKDFKLPDVLPSVFLFDSDLSAQNFMLAVLNQGYTIPESFSVASFDNTKLCEETIPRLTSIGVSSKDIADAAYRVMLKRLSSTELRPYMTVLTSTITVRDSVRRIK